MFKVLSNKEIYDNSSLSFTFEFFTKLNKREASAKIARALGKTVKWFTDPNSDYTPTYETFKIAPIYSNGYKEISLSTGFLPYQEAMHMFLKTLNIIESIGHTTNRCSVKTKIRLDESELGLSVGLAKLNKFKYLLGINEEALFNLWPTQENENKKIYQNHLQFIQPRDVYNTIISEGLVERMSPNEFNFPESDFFATDFSELGKSTLVINYISGKDYTKKKREAVETINLVIEHIYSTLSSNYTYSTEDKRKISKIVNEFKDSIIGTKNYANFKNLYPDIILYVDLRQDNYLIEANYPIIREKIFKIVVGGGLDSAVINYDTRRKSLQVKDSTISKSILVEGIEFYQCTIEADSKNCLFEGCDIRNSKLVDCSIFSNNTIKNSKIINCDYLGEANEISSSYLDNNENKMISANLTECLVNRGSFSMGSSLDKKTMIIKHR